VDERFDRLENSRDDLIALARRLERMEIGDKIRRAEAELPRRAQLTGQPLHKRLASNLISLWRLTWTRRQTAILEDDVANLRRAVTSVVENEFASLAGEMRALIAATEDLRAATHEGLGRVEGVASDAARGLEREGTARREEIATLDGMLRFERLTRQKAFSDFDRSLVLAALKSPPATAASETASPTPSPPPSIGVQSLLESFYFLLEERYRGTREEIKQRLLVYRGDLRDARDRAGVAGPVIDIGCGRGELLELLTEDGFQAVGVDSSDLQLEAARQRGLGVIHGEAFDYLRSLPTGGVLAVTGIHVVEHIPFPDLVRLMGEVARVLKKGGVAIFETPNPRNLIVGATTFHFDPTHIRPLPPEVLAILLEVVGFAHVETRPLHPSGTLETMVREHGMDRHLATLLFGPQDYAAIGAME
jgi:O-antigen chain-terminating methyltransferase